MSEQVGGSVAAASEGPAKLAVQAEEIAEEIAAKKKAIEEAKNKDATIEKLTAELAASKAELAASKAELAAARKQFDTDINSAKESREDELKKAKDSLAAKEAEIVTLKSVSPTGSPDMTKQIAELKVELDKAKAAATASPNQAKIDKILENFKTNQPYEDDKYTISKLNEGFHIKLKASVSPTLPAVSPTLPAVSPTLPAVAPTTSKA
jgi:chromosome segregation ATPase